MTKHISIHKAEFHNVFFTNTEENEDLLEEILSIDKLIYPLVDKGNYYLYNVEEKTLLSKSTTIDDFSLEKDIEILSLIGITIKDILKFNLPKKTKHLIFEGGDLMPSQMKLTKQGDVVWKKVMNFIYLYKLITTIEESLVIEGELRNIYKTKLPKYVTDFGLTKLFEWVEDSNVTELTTTWTFYKDSDFILLSKLKQLESLSLLYCYNDNIKWLPKNLTSLKIFGSLIQKLSEINLNLPHLKNLDLSGNTINSLDNLLELPKSLEELVLNKNLIENFNINELPENLNFLDLSQNLITNDFFNQKSKHENVKFLFLSNNKLVITTSIVHAIFETFPNLEYLELLGNETDGVPFEFLGDFENKNCLEHVNILLEEIDYKHNENVLDHTKSKDLSHYVEVIWIQELLPLKVILSDVQYVFSKHFSKMPSFSQYLNGLSCFITHDNCEIFLQFSEDKKQVLFKVASDNPDIVSLYFHKYLDEVNRLIVLNFHLNILPRMTNSKSCDFLQDFYNQVFKLDYKVKKQPVLKLSQQNISILINNRKIEIETNRNTDAPRTQGKTPGNQYEASDNIAFILISGKSAYPFIINDHILTNAINLKKEDYYHIILRDAEEKENYVNGITSNYLNNSSFVEVDVFIDNNIKKKVSCFVNPNYFKVNNNILAAVNLELTKLDEKYLKEIKMDNGKYCEFNIDEDHIELKYVI